MKHHTEQEFITFISQLKETNATLNFFCDFNKISDNVSAIELKLNQLNYLLGKDDLNNCIKLLWEENKNVFDVLEILIAVRKTDNKKVIDNNEVIKISSLFRSVEGVLKFIHETGLDEVFKSKKIKNLVDYVFGIETGLDTNARKNRSGHIMENTVASIFDSHNIPYRQEVYSSDYPELSILGEDEKRFDFVIETKNKTYLIEVNFYSGGGSKLNETARAYTELAPKINALNNFEFVWITDGQGWLSAKNKLEEAFYAIPSVFNLTSINDFINKII
ncbi:MAG: type II restriction endonuclease [Bacteroidales bacterium]|nr:type II restriction endonuclease [Bacteroidales bacterium]